MERKRRWLNVISFDAVRAAGSVGSLVLLALLLPGCLEQSTVAPGPVPVERLTPSGAGTYTGLTEPLRAVVRDPGEWKKLWDAAFASGPVPPLPDVDFSTHIVLVVALGERASGGYTIQVTEVFRTGAGIEARVRSTAPGKGCVVTLAITQPADFVSVPVRDPIVEFAESEQVTDCR